MSDDFDFEIISENNIQKSARGRKPNADSVKIANALLTLNPGQAILIKSMAVDLNAKNAGVKKAQVSASIRSAARIAGRNVKISFRPSDGVPQVSVV